MSEAGTWQQTIYNRPAEVRAIHGETVRVRWQDNGTLGFVPLDAIGNVREVSTDAGQGGDADD
ncbi:hypothetical protein [Halostella pelagica]|uniref:hypothetical protein n=1 Tax=Halostella pelagica TaxID=2583824 RepID=UPI0010814004|nr:hypothetical protein [Halostella pelagica]